MKRFAGLVAGFAAALALSACESGAAPQDGKPTGAAPAAATARACAVSKDNRKVNDILAKVEKGGSVAEVRAMLADAKDAIAKAAEAASHVRPGTDVLDEIGCRKTAVIAWSALMSLPTPDAKWSAARFDQARIGQATCKGLTAAQRSEGSTRACAMFDIYVTVATAEAEAARLVEANGKPVSAASLDSARQSVERFQTSVEAEWPQASPGGVFGDLRQGVFGAAACTVGTQAMGLARKGQQTPELQPASIALAKAREAAMKSAVGQLSTPATPGETTACRADAQSDACSRERLSSFNTWCFSYLGGG